MEKLFIVKIGGNIIDDPGKLNRFLEDFAQIDEAKILVHGGGKIATEVSNALGIQPQLIDGRRITDAGSLKVVTMVYAGLINKNIVAQLQAHQCQALGLTGADMNCIPATKRKVGTIDYGFVGDIAAAQVQTKSLQLLLNQNFTPVIAPITHDGAGNLLNTNADTIAATLAIAFAGLYQVHLIYLFEKPGVLRDVNDPASLIPDISIKKYQELRDSGIIAQGMIPKMDNAIQAIQAGVQGVYIAHADNIIPLISDKQAVGTVLHL